MKGSLGAAAFVLLLVLGTLLASLAAVFITKSKQSDHFLQIRKELVLLKEPTIRVINFRDKKKDHEKSSSDFKRPTGN